MSTTVAPAAPAGVRRIAERRVEIAVPFHTHSAWSSEDAWLVHGVTGRAVDMTLFGSTAAGQVLPRWVALRSALGCDVIVHARQVHGADVLVHNALPSGILIASDADGHVTARVRALLAVSVADCVPISIAAPDVRAIGLLHGGWRGVAAGIVEHGIETLTRSFGAAPEHLLVHCGPAICGDCYEVGPEVPAQLGLDATSHVDLRAVIAARALAAGARADHITISTHCTRCGSGDFFSHRGGSAERQIAVLGIRA